MEYLEIGKNIKCYNISFIDPLIFYFSSLKLNFSSSKEKKKNKDDLNDYLLDNKSSYIEMEKLLSENNKILFNINYQNKKKYILDSKKQIDKYQDLNYSISRNHNSVSPNNFFPKKGKIMNLDYYIVIIILLIVKNLIIFIWGVPTNLIEKSFIPLRGSYE